MEYRNSNKYSNQAVAFTYLSVPVSLQPSSSAQPGVHTHSLIHRPYSLYPHSTIMASKRNPLRELTPTESDLDNNSNNSSSSNKGQGETLREKASKSLHGPDANPSQLGDPVSLKAEASDNIPKPDEAGSQSSSTPPSKSGGSSSGAGGEKLREKAAKKLHGPDANPSQLGDPISLKAEQSGNVPTPGEEGAHPGGREQQQPGGKGRPSKL